MIEEIEEDHSPSARITAAAAFGAQVRGECAADALAVEDRPKISDAMLCEVAEAGHYDQLMLRELTKHTTKHTWSECTDAMHDALHRGLVESSTGTVRLTNDGEAVLAQARKVSITHASAIARIGRFLATEDAKERAAAAQTASEQRSVNDALSRLLSLDDGAK